jgi:hypothetical protein
MVCVADLTVYLPVLRALRDDAAEICPVLIQTMEP